MLRPMILGEHTLPNGRRYLLTDTGLPYQNGEYPKGGGTLCLRSQPYWHVA